MPGCLVSTWPSSDKRIEPSSLAQADLTLKPGLCSLQPDDSTVLATSVADDLADLQSTCPSRRALNCSAQMLLAIQNDVNLMDLAIPTKKPNVGKARIDRTEMRAP